MIDIKTTETKNRLQINEILETEIIKANNTTYATICNSCHLIYLIEGGLSITFDGRNYKMVTGDVAIFSLNDFYCIKETEEATYLRISFSCDQELSSQYEAKLVETSYFENQIALEICSLENQIDNILAYNKLCSLTELIILYCSSENNKPENKYKRDAEIFYKAITIFKENLQSQISVENLAKSLNISLSHLKRIFAEYAAIGVHEYFNYLKIKLAKEKLSEGMSVTDTAQYLGFANQAYFSTTFKRIAGISPKEFSLEKYGSTLNKVKSFNEKVSSREMPSYLL